MASNNISQDKDRRPDYSKPNQSCLPLVSHPILGFRVFRSHIETFNGRGLDLIEAQLNLLSKSGGNLLQR